MNPYRLSALNRRPHTSEVPGWRRIMLITASTAAFHADMIKLPCMSRHRRGKISRVEAVAAPTLFWCANEACRRARTIVKGRI
jgi:hypothetical protein